MMVAFGPRGQYLARLASWLVTLSILVHPLIGRAADRLFVINSRRDVVTIVDPSTGDLAEIELSDGLRAHHVTMSTDGRTAYIWSASLETVSLIDTATGRLVSKLENAKDRMVVFPKDASRRDGAAGLLDDTGGLMAVLPSHDQLLDVFDSISERLYHGWKTTKVLLAIDPSTRAVIARIPLDDYPRVIVPDPDGTRVFVVHPYSISAIDPDSQKVTRQLRINGGVTALEVSPDGTRGFATKTGSDLLTIIDLKRWRAIGYVRIDPQHADLEVSPDSRRLYISGPAGMSIVDIATMAVATSIQSPHPGDIVLAANGTRALVVGGELALFDLEHNALIKTLALGASVSYALTADGSRLYIVSYAHGHSWNGTVVRIIDASTGDILETFADDRPASVHSAPDGRVYVTQPASGVVRVIDPLTAATTAVIPPLELGDGVRRSPIDIAFTSGPDLAFVTYALRQNSRRGVVAVYRTSDFALEKTATWGDEPFPDPSSPFYYWDIGAPSHIAVKPDGSEAYVVMESPTVAVIDMNSLSITHVIDLAIPEDAISDLAITPDGRRVYTTRWVTPSDNDAQSLVVIDTDTKEVSKRVGLPGNSSYGLAIVPDGSKAFVTTTFSDWESNPFASTEHLVSVIDLATDSITSTLTLATTNDTWGSSSYVATSPDGATIYATQWSNGTVAAIDPETNALLGTFPAGDLPTRLAVSSGVAFAALPTLSPTPTPTASPDAVPTEVPTLPHLNVPALVLHEESVTYTSAGRSTPVSLDGVPVSVIADPTSTAGYVVGVSSWQEEEPETLVWRVIDGQAELVASLSLGAMPVHATMSTDGTLLHLAARLLDPSPYAHLGYGFDTLIVVLEIQTGAWRTIATLEGLPCAVAAGPDGRSHVTTNRRTQSLVPTYYDRWDKPGITALEINESIVTTFEATTHRPISRTATTGSCFEAGLSPDGNRLAIVGDDDVRRSRHVTLVDLQRDAPAFKILVPEMSPWAAILWSPDGNLVYVAAYEELVVFDTRSGSVAGKLILPNGATAVSTPPRSLVSYFSTHDGIVLLFDPAGQRTLARAPSPPGRVTALCPDCLPPDQTPERTPISSLPSVPPLPFPPPPPGLPPITERQWARVDDAAADPGDRVELSVTLYSVPAAGGMSAELWLPSGVTFAPWVDGKPDCEVMPDIGGQARGTEQSAIAYLPTGCTPGVDCSGVFLDVISEWRLNLFYSLPHEIFRCRVDVDDSLTPGNYPLIIAGTSTSSLDWDGSRVSWPLTAFDGTLIVGGGQQTPTPVDSLTPSPVPPTATPSRAPNAATPTGTARASATPTTMPTTHARVALQVDPISAQAGDLVTLSVRLRSAAGDVAAIQNELEIDPHLSIRRCRVNPEIGKAGIFGLYSSTDEPLTSAICPTGQLCDHLRAIIVSFDDTSPIPNGSVLYTCTVEVPASTPSGSYSVTLSGVVASDEHGRRIDGDVSTAAVQVRGATFGSRVEQTGPPDTARREDGCTLHESAGAAHELLISLMVFAILLLKRRQPRDR